MSQWLRGDRTIGNPDLPAWAKVTLYEYEGGKGRKVAEITDAGGGTLATATRYIHDDLGNTTRVTENAYGEANLRRKTEYGHQYGRVLSITAARTNVTSVLNRNQTTAVAYNAKIVNADFEEASQNNGLIGSMVFPPENETTTPPPFDVKLKYNFAGLVAEREDYRGVVFRNRYDDLGRLTSVEVGHYATPGLASSFTATYPPSMTPSTGVPMDRVGFVEYEYDNAGDVFRITARAAQSGGIITQSQFDYDERGNLLKDWQAYGEAVNTASTPRTSYAWHYQPTSAPTVTPADPGRTRLASMTYPSHNGSTARTVTMGYGSSGSAEDRLSRIASMTTNLGTTATVGQFEYIGSGRRASLWLAGAAIAQTFMASGSVGMPGLDSFGRVADLHFRNSAGQTLYRSEHAYDAAGNVRWSTLTQSSTGGTPVVNARSTLNQYDELNRLVKTDVGVLTFPGGTPTIAVPDLLRSDTWQIDLLGNWVGANQSGMSMGPTIPPDSGRFSSGHLDQYGTPWAQPGADPGTETFDRRHEVNGQNELFRMTLTPEGGPAVQHEPRFDGAGNLQFDGQYYYQYDAWNRLIQVNQAVATGSPSGPIVIGLMVKHHTYDGVGRLVRTQSPYPDPQSGGAAGELRSERFYYDGVRRIQEVVIDPLADGDSAMNSGDPGLSALAAATMPPPLPGQNLDGSAAPLALEEGQIEGAASSSPPPTTGTAREYIWGPGDSGFDELLVQYDEYGNAAWAIQDLAGDLVALCDLGVSGGTARVIGQWTYDAYGAVLSAEHFYAFAHPHLGHKGLFHDRLDVGIVGTGGLESPRLVPFAHAVYHVRNRAYSPATGRWFQRDPNQTAMTLLSATSSHGRGMGAISLAFDMEGLYGDGANLYEYLGSNPSLRWDPLGLAWDPFDMVDDYLTEWAGSVGALLGQLGQSAKAAGIVAATIASYLPFPFAGNLGEIALFALGENNGEEFATAIALGLIPGSKIAAKIGGFVSKIGASIWKYALHYANKYGRPVLAAMAKFNPYGFSARALEYLKKVCGCFEAGTPIWTFRGLLPIEEVQSGDLVLAQDETTGQLSLRRVLRTFIRRGAPIVAVTLTSAATCGETLRTTEEHPFWVESRGWVAAGDLRAGDVVHASGGAAVVASVAFTGERQTVFNFEVEGVHTYRVGGAGVLVHNRGSCELPHHHAWPVFLRGPEVQQLVPMPVQIHRRFHGDLLHEMSQAGISKPRDMTWDLYFRDNPGHYDIATNTLYDLSARYDAMYLNKPGGYNSSLVVAIIREMQSAAGMR